MFVQIPGSHHPGTRLCLIPGFRDPGSILILEQVTQYGNPYLICITVSFKDCTITYFWLIVTEVHEEFSTYCILIYSQSILPLTSCQCARQWSPSRRPYNNTNWYQADIQDFLVLVYNVGASNESKATLFCLFCLCAQNHSYFFQWQVQLPTDLFLFSRMKYIPKLTDLCRIFLTVGALWCPPYHPDADVFHWYWQTISIAPRKKLKMILGISATRNHRELVPQPQSNK